MDSLRFYDVGNTATIDTTLAIGTVAPSSSDDTELRLQNTSDLYQAEDVTVTITGPDAVQLWLSADGDTFGPSINLGDIPPGGISPAFWLRRVTPSTSPVSTRTAALSAQPVGWTTYMDTSASDNVPITED